MPARPAAWSLARASLSAPPHAARRSTLHASGDREARGEGRPPPWRAHRPEKWSAVWPYNWTLLALLLVRNVGRMTINDAPETQGLLPEHTQRFYWMSLAFDMFKSGGGSLVSGGTGTRARPPARSLPLDISRRGAHRGTCRIKPPRGRG